MVQDIFDSVKPVYVLDAYALPRLAQGESGADKVAEMLASAQSGLCRVLLHQMNLGEVVYLTSDPEFGVLGDVFTTMKI